MKNRWNTLGRALALLVCLLTVAGCGIRLETPAPGPLVPGPNETARQAAVTDVSEISQLANNLLDNLEQVSVEAGFTQSQQESLTAVLTTIVTFSQAHYDALGGEYVSGLDVVGTPSPDTLPDAAADPGLSELNELQTKLSSSYLRTRASLPLIPDAELAHLLGSISLAQLLQSTELAEFTAMPATPVPVDPVADTSLASYSDNSVGSQSTAPSPPAASGPAVSSLLVPLNLPEPLGALELSAVVVDEDNVGYLFELRSAYLADAERLAAQHEANTHRHRAEAWALLSEISRTAEDPRLLNYRLSESLSSTASDAEVLSLLNRDIAALSVRLVQHYLYLGFLVSGQDRLAFHDLAAVNALRALSLGSQPVDLPGL